MKVHKMPSTETVEGGAEADAQAAGAALVRVPGRLLLGLGLGLYLLVEAVPAFRRLSLSKRCGTATDSDIPVFQNSC